MVLFETCVDSHSEHLACWDGSRRRASVSGSERWIGGWAFEITLTQDLAMWRSDSVVGVDLATTGGSSDMPVILIATMETEGMMARILWEDSSNGPKARWWRFVALYLERHKLLMAPKAIDRRNLYHKTSIRLSTAMAFRGINRISLLSVRVPPVTSFKKICSELLSSVNLL